MSCDNVCIGVEVDFHAEFYVESKHKARKSTKCCECNRTILAGERYHRAVGKWEGVLETYRQCLECEEIQKTFACGDGFLFEQLWSDMFQVFGSLTVRNPCFLSLSQPAKAFLTEKWWEWKESTADRRRR